MNNDIYNETRLIAQRLFSLPSNNDYMIDSCLLSNQELDPFFAIRDAIHSAESGKRDFVKNISSLYAQG